VVGCYEYGDEYSGSGATESVSLSLLPVKCMLLS
jgi:hypothetical protein